MSLHYFSMWSQQHSWRALPTHHMCFTLQYHMFYLASLPPLWLHYPASCTIIVQDLHRHHSLPQVPQRCFNIVVINEEQNLSWALFYRSYITSAIIFLFPTAFLAWFFHHNNITIQKITTVLLYSLLPGSRMFLSSTRYIYSIYMRPNRNPHPPNPHPTPTPFLRIFYYYFNPKLL